MSRKIRIFTTDFIYFCCALLLSIALAFWYAPLWGAAVTAICAALCAMYLYFGIFQKVKWQRLVMKALENEEAMTTYLNTMAIPIALTTPAGAVKWCSLAFRNITSFGAMRSISRMIPGINVPDKDKKILIRGRAYKKELFKVPYRGSEMLLYRLIDVENMIEAKRLYQSFLPVVCHIQVDNYEELSADMTQTELSEVIASVERRISAMAKSVSAMFIRTDRGRYTCVLERRFLSTLRASKFRVLDDVRQIRATLSPTLSFAVGVGETPEQSAEFAGKALELALGRGGDQAVIKQGDQYVFFGGAAKTVYRRNKVKSRMTSHALRNLMEQCSDVFIMGHEVPDLDCMGASLGLCACARHIGKKAYMVVEHPNPSIQPLLERIAEVTAYDSAILSGAEAGMRMGASSMLIIVDTQLEDFTVAPSLIGLSDTVVVIDHHLRGTTNIEDTALYYHEPYASSACELVTEILQYFGEDLKPLPVDLDALLCGITIDTKGFSFNTGVRTFEAASYLRRLGADTTGIRQLVQDDLKTYTAKSDVVKNAEVLPGGIAMASCPEGTESAPLIAAQAADELLTIRGISASFVVCREGDNVIISGRSLGEVNVQLLLESLGGGGHATIAAVKLKGTDVKSAYALLKKTIKKEIREEP
jgi:c-di-AMP phosphodiesterase-like protein